MDTNGKHEGWPKLLIALSQIEITVSGNNEEARLFNPGDVPPPSFSTYGNGSVLFDSLPSLRQAMLIGLGLSLTSSFIYCAQLLYPPLSALWGGTSVTIGGAFMNVLFARWSYRRFIADWEEEWWWKREVMKNKLHQEEFMKQKQQWQQQREGKSTARK